MDKYAVDKIFEINDTRRMKYTEFNISLFAVLPNVSSISVYVNFMLYQQQMTECMYYRYQKFMET